MVCWILVALEVYVHSHLQNEHPFFCTYPVMTTFIFQILIPAFSLRATLHHAKHMDIISVYELRIKMMKSKLKAEQLVWNLLIGQIFQQK